MAEYEPLVAALENWFNKPFTKLPRDKRARVKRAFVISWRSLTPAQRRRLAQSYDYEHDPANAAARASDAAFYNEWIENDKEIAKWEAISAHTITELATKEDRLKPLRARAREFEEEHRMRRGDDLTTAPHPSRRTAVQEAECCKWLVEMMKPSENPGHPKAHYREEAQRRFNVGTRAFDRAWDSAIAKTGRIQWKAAGRKPKKSKHRND
ncbi:MAG: hypothetical protein U1F68_17300 [Gammaproteobacteria bacterium]